VTRVPDRRKAHGVHYTPAELAGFLCEEALALVGDQEPLRVLDPACGDGSLLLALAAAAGAGRAADMRVVGLDQDAEALEVARGALETLPFAGIELRQADFLAGTAPPPGGFDLVVANPPYVRTQVLGAERSRQLARTHGLSGRVDLFHAFLRAMTGQLRDGGVLALLCSNRFLSTQAGEAVRALLQRDYQLRSITDLGDTKPFRAAVLPAVVVARRQRSPAPDGCRFTRVYTAADPPAPGPPAGVPEMPSAVQALRSGVSGAVSIGGDRYVIERGVLETDGGRGHAWRLSHPELAAWLETVEAHSARSFADVARIRVGIKTTCDSVFIRNDWAVLPSDLRPEPELLHPLLTHHEARRWSASPPASRVLYPHQDAGGRAGPVDLARYPRARAYLERHRDRLAARTYLKEAGRHWFEIWVAQRPSDWPKRKVVFPDIASEPRFLLDTSGALVNGDCYWMALDDEVPDELVYLLLAVGNSSFAMRWYDAVCGNRLYGSRRRFITQYVKSFPLPDLRHPAAGRIVALARELVACGDGRAALEAELDRLVWAAFGLPEGDPLRGGRPGR
jgi:adenine-specific DNA-methyltransferase